MAQDDTIRAASHVVDLYRRGIFCEAVLWEYLIGKIPDVEAGMLLDGLSTDLQNVLRDAYEKRPWSLRSERSDGQRRREIEA